MLTRLASAILVLAGCSANPEVATAPHEMSGPTPMTLHVAGEGTEVHAIRSNATIGEIHRAVSRSAARRLTNEADGEAGLELAVLDVDGIDALIRAQTGARMVVPDWLGIPVQWHRVAVGPASMIQVRSWPLITELGPRAVVEYRVVSDGGTAARRELLVVPGQAVVLMAGAATWPADPDLRDPPVSMAAAAMGWSRDQSDAAIGMILLVPRFEPR
ncbi:MAG: hypothetical protein GY894_06725 [Planctomycetes bacterium]|nr:hypothetical protein [Planctomycetota bacterium]